MTPIVTFFDYYCNTSFIIRLIQGYYKVIKLLDHENKLRIIFLISIACDMYEVSHMFYTVYWYCLGRLHALLSILTMLNNSET